MERDDAAHWEQVEEAAELLGEGQFGDALLALRDVIRAHPDNPYAYQHAGVALFETGQFEPARDAFRAALRLSPDYLGARVSLSHVLRRLGDPRAALVEATTALERFPKDPDAMHAAALAQAALGQRSKARANLEGVLAGRPTVEAADEVRRILETLGLGEEGDPVDFD